MEINDLFTKKPYINVCAPMVRYSKLEFRSLVRKYGCDLCFTPMIMADSFVKSEKARNNEFTTSKDDTPLIVQFAATNTKDFLDAVELAAPYSDGVDLNCGCPQRWAMKIGIGAQLLYEPEKIKDMVKQVQNRVSSSYSVSVKMRLVGDIRKSVDLCRQLESAGVNFLTVHGRTKDQKSDPVNVEALKTISETLKIPVIANGDVKSVEDALLMHKLTGCKGIMTARGILQNPAMFSGFSVTPRECVQNWISTALYSDLYFITFHHHLVFMLEKVLQKHERKLFNNLNNYEQVIKFMNDFYGFDFQYEPNKLTKEGLWEISDKGSYFIEKTETEYFLNDTFLIN